MEVKHSPKTKDSSPSPTNTSALVGRTTPPQVRPGGTANVTATDVASAFKSFAAQQSVQTNRIRSNGTTANKEVKLIELKMFAASFKRNSPVPSDDPIIAEDPAKQREIQEKAKRDAEEQEKAKQAKQRRTAD